MDLLELFQSSAFIWFIIGIVFIIIEWLTPQFILIFFATGAWLTSLMLIITPTSLDNQLILFLSSSIISLISLHKIVKKKFFRGKSVNNDQEIIGKIATVIHEFGTDSYGKVEFKGTLWIASSNENLKKDDKVKITGYDSIRLQVRKLSSS